MNDLKRHTESHSRQRGWKDIQSAERLLLGGGLLMFLLLICFINKAHFAPAFGYGGRTDMYLKETLLSPPYPHWPSDWLPREQK